MKTQINVYDLGRINQGLYHLRLGLDPEATGIKDLIVDFLDNDFSPPLRPSWRKAWNQNKRLRPWMGGESWLGDVHSAHFRDGPLDDGQWEHLHRVAIGLIRIAAEDHVSLHITQARRLIGVYLESVGHEQDVTTEAQ